jgi:hypothetical protein
MDEMDQSVREETIERLILRDKILAGYATILAGAIGATVDRGNFRPLLIVPVLSVALCLLSIHHDTVLQYLHAYLKRKGIEWENSPELSRYKKGWSWTRLVAEVIVFCGGNVGALILNRDLALAACSQMLSSAAWWLGMLLTVISFAMLCWIRLVFRQAGHLPPAR